MKHILTSITMFIALLLSVSVAKGSEESGLFGSDQELEIQLQATWRTLQRMSDRDRSYPAILSYSDSSGVQQQIPIKVEPRGRSRRFVTCDFPPLRILLDPEETAGTIFAGESTMRLTTYCKHDTKYEQYAIKEYIAYRIYNLLSDYSVRVRPLIITYKDSKSNATPLVRFSYLSEDSKDVARRTGLNSLNMDKVSYKHYAAVEASRFAMFQLLIGNVDWSLIDGKDGKRCCHNASILGASQSAGDWVPVPYDFDSSGLIEARYAAPPESLKLHSIRERLYRGFCYYNQALPETVAHFNAKKPEILALFERSSRLDSDIGKRAVKYIEDFYQLINDPQRLQNEVIDKCRGESLL